MFECVAYHGTTVEAYKLIMESKFIPSQKSINGFNTEWLGKGIYFWGDLGDAFFWCKNSSKSTNSAIISTRLEAPKERTLDLCHSMKDILFFRKFCEEVKCRSPRIDHNKLRVAPKHYLEQAIKIAVKKLELYIVIACFDCRNKETWPTDNDWHTRFQIITPQIQICVKNDTCIKEKRSLSENESGELKCLKQLLG